MEVTITHKNKRESVSIELAETLCLRGVATMEGEHMTIQFIKDYKLYKKGEVRNNIPFIVAKNLIESGDAVAFDPTKSGEAIKAKQAEAVKEIEAVAPIKKVRTKKSK